MTSPPRYNFSDEEIETQKSCDWLKFTQLKVGAWTWNQIPSFQIPFPFCFTTMPQAEAPNPTVRAKEKSRIEQTHLLWPQHRELECRKLLPRPGCHSPSIRQPSPLVYAELGPSNSSPYKILKSELKSPQNRRPVSPTLVSSHHEWRTPNLTSHELFITIIAVFIG